MVYICQQMKTKEEILALAQEHAAQQGWAWLGRVEILEVVDHQGRKNWSVRTNRDAMGCNIEMFLDPDGKVVSGQYLPR